MTNALFWSIATVVLIAAVAISLAPVLGSGGRARGLGLASVAVLTVAGLGLYTGAGTPEALSLLRPADLPVDDVGMDGLAEQLHAKLEETPEHLEGWLLLARTYKSLQRYPEALEAMETALRLAPEAPLVQVEWVEASLFASGNPRLTPDLVDLLERAVAAAPELQKGLWLLGIAAAQRGDDAVAIEWWQKLMQQVEPGSPVAASVAAQIDEAHGRLGTASAPPDVAAADVAPADVAAAAWPIRVLLSAEAESALAGRGEEPSLFLIVRSGDSAAGPPLGARRIANPEFPLDVNLTDQDSMMPQRPISSAANLTVQARLSFSGQPMAAPGDWQSGVIVLAGSGGNGNLLVVDHVVN